MRKYESMMILRPALEEEQVNALLDEVKALISREGGQMDGIDVWGMRRLEYPIKHEESGHYAVVHYHAEPEVVKELERVMGINDNVLRIKTLVVEGKKA